MPSQVLNITEAKAKLSSVIEQVVSKGEEFLIGRAGKPVAKIVPYQASRKPRRLGSLRGKIKIAKDFDEWPKDLAEFLGMP